jgi:hypothetical protein
LLGQITTADVCFWRKADMAYALANVCFRGNSGETTAAYIFSLYSQHVVGMRFPDFLSGK